MSLPANTNPYPCQFDRPKGNFSVGIVGLKKTEGLFKIANLSESGAPARPSRTNGATGALARPLAERNSALPPAPARSVSADGPG
jgi:hypothetical protein